MEEKEEKIEETTQTEEISTPEEQQIEVEKSKFLKLIVVIIFLTVCVLGIGGYIIYDNLPKSTSSKDELKDKEESTTTTETTTTTTTTTRPKTEKEKAAEKKLAQELYKIIDVEGACGRGLEWNFDGKKILTYDDIDDATKFEIVANTLNNKGKLESATEFEPELKEELKENPDLAEFIENKINYKDIAPVYYQIFGKKKINYIDKFDYRYEFYEKYDTNNYISFTSVMDCDVVEEFYAFFYDYKGFDDTFELYVKYSYLVLDDENSNNDYYRNSKDERICGKDDIEKHLDELDTYKYTFKYDGENYIWESVEQVDYKK